LASVHAEDLVKNVHGLREHWTTFNLCETAHSSCLLQTLECVELCCHFPICLHYTQREIYNYR